jgi:hypothetical protein
LTAPGGLDWKTDASSKTLSAGITAYKRIERVTGWREGRLALAERASAAAPEFCAWQQARSPADEGTGQFVPQQGALIATAPCAIPQAKPACNATRSASNANIPFFTGTKLISSTARCKRARLQPSLAKLGISASCTLPARCSNESDRPVGTCSKRQQKAASRWSESLPFRA